jgi:hypothetical protein
MVRVLCDDDDDTDDDDGDDNDACRVQLVYVPSQAM